MLFLNSACSAAVLVFYLPVVCTHTDKQREARVRNILKSSKKTQYLMNTLYLGGEYAVASLFSDLFPRSNPSHPPLLTLSTPVSHFQVNFLIVSPCTISKILQAPPPARPPHNTNGQTGGDYDPTVNPNQMSYSTSPFYCGLLLLRI